MEVYDTIIVLGKKPDEVTWKFPVSVYKCLDRVKELYDEGVTKTIILSGKYYLGFEKMGITQPYDECDEMAKYLIEKGVPENAILRENLSKDTISNLYYTKTKFLIPLNLKKLLLVLADWRAFRVEYLCRKVLGRGYQVDIERIPAADEDVDHETRAMEVNSKFLSKMRNGDHAWLDGKLYTDPYFQEDYDSVEHPNPNLPDLR